MSQFFNVCSTQIKIINGEEKITYQKVGFLKISDNGGYYLNLHQQPNTEFRIFNSQEEELPTID